MLPILITSFVRIASVSADRESLFDLLRKVIGSLLRVYLGVLVGVLTVHQMMNYHIGFSTLFHEGGNLIVYTILVKAEAVEWHSMLSTKEKKEEEEELSRM